MCKKKEITDLTPFTKINSKWIIDLNVECKTIKFLEDNIGENLDDLGCSDNCLDKTPKVSCIRAIMYRLDFIRIKNECLLFER